MHIGLIGLGKMGFNMRERLRNGGAQVWLTGTELAPFAEIESEAAVWRVNGGTVERVS